jgi:molybdopterin molybdotransferase
LIPVEEAQALVLALAGPPQTETVPLSEAAGRWLTTPAIAQRDQPPFPASAMDGYAVTAAAPGESFTVVGEALAGHAFPGSVAPGEAVRIFTGAPVPQGAARVVIQEDVIRAGDRITVKEGMDAGTHIRPQGQDFCTGDSIGPRRLRPADLALLASMNVPWVTVARRPVVAIIPTGDELVQPGETPRDDQIIASNGVALKAMAEEAGAVVRLLPIARDNLAALGTVLGLAEGTDLIVTIGGASVGDHDLVARVAGDMGFSPAFHKIAMRPGKPLMAGRFGESLLMGLPGNPVSSVACAILFMLPLIRAMQGDSAPLPKPHRATLATDTGPTGPRTHYMRARLDQTEGLPRITPFDRQDSALLSVLAQADALLIRPMGDGPRRAGETVDFLPL